MRLFAGLLALASLGLFVATFSPLAFAHEEGGKKEEHGGKGHHYEPEAPSLSKTPANVYSGRTPIDRKNGIGFNQGTVGLPNEDYEKWASTKTWAVGLSERSYPYELKESFVITLDERLMFYEAAVNNWGRTSDITKPEAKEYASKAIADIEPRLSRARSAWSKAKSAGKADWERSQEDAKLAFVELQSFYYGLHKNVR